MGLLLKEALKCLCGDGGWSYAVFWKISCRNPMLLMWEEGHYESARHSGVSSISAPENPELLLKGWEALWNPTELCSSEGEAQAEDKVSTVFNQMLHQVHVVGEGLVGHVAFTGKHQWVFRETYMGEMYSARPIDCSTDSQGPAGCYHQFSARIQTIAAIPVLPEGVVQLGSTQTIMENMEFVNNVQMLIMQLKRVPGAFLPENTQKAVGQRYVSLGTSVPALPSRNPCAKVGSSLPFVGNSCERHILKPPALRFLSQPSTFSTQNMQTNASALLLTSGSINSSTESFGYIFQKPNIPLGTQMENGARGAQVIISNPNVQLNQQFAQYNSSSGSSHQLSVVGSGVSSSIRTPIEQQILSGVGFEGPIKKPPYNKTSMPLQRPYGSTTPGSPNDCTIVDPLFGRDGTLNTGNCLGVLNSTPRGTLKSVDTCQSCQSIGSAGLQSANLPTLLPSSNHQNNSINVPVISGESWPGHSSTVNRHDQTARATRQGQVDNDLFQALAFLMAGSGGDEHPALFKGISGFVEDSSESCLNPLKESRGSASCEENGTVIANYEISTKGPHNYNPIDTVKENALDTLGQDFSINHLHLNLDDLLVQEGQNLRGASCISGSDLVPVFDDTGRGYFSEAKPDHLLDAVVSKFCSSSNQNSDDNSSCKTTLTKIASPLVDADSHTYGSFSAPEQTAGELVGLSQALANAEITGSGCSVKFMDKVTERSQIDGTTKSQISSWLQDGQSIKCDSSLVSHSKKADEPVKPNRKRPRPGESSRPRPKDRQMIQDRVKELREIVPNGAKCSIDALLERTIKHMLFLQSVTKHADKLKQTGESKLISKEGGLLCAFEVGSQSMVCPIIVEDLSHPRQMLVEMLCEERGFFLEIADIIRGLGLTILKGVMEARNEKVWARFAVEANRDVTRVEIFLSLVRLLEQTAKASVTQKGICDPVVQNACHQALPVTGLVESLQ